MGTHLTLSILQLQELIAKHLLFVGIVVIPPSEKNGVGRSNRLLGALYPTFPTQIANAITITKTHIVFIRSNGYNSDITELQSIWGKVDGFNEVYWLAETEEELQLTCPSLFSKNLDEWAKWGPGNPYPFDNPPEYEEIKRLISLRRKIAFFNRGMGTNEDEPNAVLEGLFVGSQASCQREWLTKYGINVVIRLGDFANMQKVDGIEYVDYTIADKPDVDISSVLVQTNALIGNCLQNGKHVLVHCIAGASRTPSIVMGYIMSECGLDLLEAFNRVFQARPLIAPNAGFVGQLMKIGDSNGTCNSYQKIQSSVIHGYMISQFWWWKEMELRVRAATESTT